MATAPKVEYLLTNGSQGEYGNVHDWKADPTDEALFEEGSLSERPDLHPRIRGRRCSSSSMSSDSSRRRVSSIRGNCSACARRHWVMEVGLVPCRYIDHADRRDRRLAGWNRRPDSSVGLCTGQRSGFDHRIVAPRRSPWGRSQRAQLS